MTAELVAVTAAQADGQGVDKERRPENCVERDNDPETGMLGSALLLLLATLISAALITVYHFWLAKPAGNFAVVDIASVVKIKESQFTALLSGPQVTDKERIAAYQLVSGIGPQIEQAIGELQKECDCSIIVKSAMIAGSAEDLTPRLKALLGITERTGERE